MSLPSRPNGAGPPRPEARDAGDTPVAKAPEARPPVAHPTPPRGAADAGVPNRAGADGGGPGAVSRQAVIRQIGVSIGELGRHLATQKDVAGAVAATSARAKAIAFKAWQVLVGGPDAPEAARALAQDLDRLSADLIGLAGRAEQEALLSSDAASILMLAAAEFTAIAGDPAAVADVPALRARLRPLAEKLDTIPARLREGKAIAQLFHAEARAAAALAQRGKALTGLKPGQVAQDVYDAMGALAAETGRMSERMMANAARGQQIATSMATQVQDLAKPAHGWSQSAGRQELSSVIGRGGAIVW